MTIDTPDILKQVLACRRERVEAAKAVMRPGKLEEFARQAEPPRDFAAAIRRDPSSLIPRPSSVRLIAEIKRRSPSKGVIRTDFDHKQIAALYDRSEASAISVLTEPDFFDGDLQHLIEVRGLSHKPALRKDFIFDEYQVYESVVAGADAILLIVAMLDDEQLHGLLQLAHSFNRVALVETHNAHEVERALSAGAQIVGINNRNLRDFSENLDTTTRLRPMIPAGVIVVSESAIRTRDDVKRLEGAGVDAILVGETLMRSEDLAAMVTELLG